MGINDHKEEEGIALQEHVGGGGVVGKTKAGYGAASSHEYDGYQAQRAAAAKEEKTSQRYTWLMWCLAFMAFAGVIALAIKIYTDILDDDADSPLADGLQDDLEALIAKITAVTGYTLSLGYKDAQGRDFGIGSGPRDPPGFATVVGGEADNTDRFLFGSGTKPMTAVAVLRLHQQGIIASLNDPASKYIDPVLADMSQAHTTMAGLLGAPAGRVTIAHLIQMQSGIADFDVPLLDNAILKEGSSSPWRALSYISSLKDAICPADIHGVCACRFMCEPGNCTSYSSTNYILAGLVLAGASREHMAIGQPLWSQWDTAKFRQALGIQSNQELAQIGIHFPVIGPLNQSLTVAGASVQYGKTEVWMQDASFLGYTCGNAVGSAQDMARFLYELLGPTASVVSESTLQFMQEWHVLDAGWAAGQLNYGAGLMIQNMSPRQKLAGGAAPVLSSSASYVGHAGDTYGFQSDSGFFPAFNASISIVVNQDTEAPDAWMTCHVLQVVARHFGSDEDFGCKPLPTVARYMCDVSFGESVCVESSVLTSANMTLDQCHAVCV